MPVYLDSAAQIETLLEAADRLDRDVDLGGGRISVRASKTGRAARSRSASSPPNLLEEHRSRGDPPARKPRLSYTNSAPRDKDNLRSRILLPAVEQADQLLALRGQAPLPQGLSPHKLRHTFASILIACGEDPASVMHQLGHVDPAFTLKVYAHMMRRGDEERARLRALVEAGENGALSQRVSSVRCR